MVKFSNYFNDWLYGNDGYYSNYKSIGKSGDFFTAVSASQFFGGSIAKRIVSTIESGFVSDNTTIVEIGAHHGYLMADIIQFIFTLKPKLLDTLTFAIVERYEHLQIKQKEYLEECYGDAIKFEHYNCIEDIKKRNAIIVANEIFDAFACDLVYTTNENELQQAFVNNHKIEFVKCEDKRIIDICNKYKITKGEVSLGFDLFAQALDNNFEKYEFITFDYGEKYPRNDFSIRIYEKHNVYPLFDDIDISKLYKTTDLTYDVNFTHLIDCFEKNNAVCEKYETQLKALVDFGIIDLLDMLNKNTDHNSYLKEVNKVKTLLEPTGMGDRFKVAIFQKWDKQ